jgi:hypothetical protein
MTIINAQERCQRADGPLATPCCTPGRIEGEFASPGISGMSSMSGDWNHIIGYKAIRNNTNCVDLQTTKIVSMNQRWERQCAYFVEGYDADNLPYSLPKEYSQLLSPSQLFLYLHLPSAGFHLPTCVAVVIRNTMRSHNSSLALGAKHTPSHSFHITFSLHLKEYQYYIKLRK